MFAVIYRAYIKPEHEKEYKSASAIPAEGHWRQFKRSDDYFCLLFRGPLATDLMF